MYNDFDYYNIVTRFNDPRSFLVSLLLIQFVFTLLDKLLIYLEREAKKLSTSVIENVIDEIIEDKKKKLKEFLKNMLKTKNSSFTLR